jgi:hypothetical protein
MTEVDGFERFLGLAFVNVKRFSIEGVDALVPMIDEAIARAAQSGTREVVIGMAGSRTSVSFRNSSASTIRRTRRAARAT